MKEISDFPNYLLTKEGEIWSKNRQRFLVGGLDPDGYKQWVACNKLGRKTLKVHRQVALLYLPNPDNHPIINHKDGVKTNNHVDNLEWCTVSHNLKEAHRLGLVDQRGDKNPASKYDNELVTEFIRTYSSEISINQHCKNFGIKYGSGYAFIKGLRRQATFNDYPERE